ncbi:1-aminocyclopropane-1-carboxylate synthase 1 [Tothia fuscella]|uniref:1-aminocyclopropane-1-carboxylate synthase 1 n=1 Tax=Tothia fuscella TaxID=1048955 RepID=A0A9P4NZ44_9PEZI|nr:1-aminocyclopropane-1-carboxylate synthase 1 [Tothia fuscella]
MKPPFLPKNCTYNEGPTGTVALRTAMANVVNEYFSPHEDISLDEITFTSGVTVLNESLALALCDPGDSVLLGQPAYGSFGNDLVQRTTVNLTLVNLENVDPFGMEAANLYEEALVEIKEQGIRVKFLMICNPHNPLGACYPKETLVALVKFIVKYNIHLVSDEIYALLVFREIPGRPNFTSVLSLDSEALGATHLVHVMYGMSKDLGCAGLRFGCLISRNAQLNHSLWPMCRFASPSDFSDHIAAHMLADTRFVAEFLAKSRVEIAEAYQRASRHLDKAGIPYYRHGNAGFFIWMDLSHWMPLEEADGDGWQAENILSQRFKESGLVMGTAKSYHGAKPGGFRLIFTLEEYVLEEGIRR